MRTVLSLLLMVALSIDLLPASAASQNESTTDSCPVTQPGLPFVPPAPYPHEAPHGFWVGSMALWTMVESDGEWSARFGPNAGLTQKIFWWRPGFSGAVENFPDFTVTLTRLDTPSEPIVATRKATNASHPSFGGSVMLTGIQIPAAGCWQITGSHRGNDVTFVVRVTGE